MIIKIAADPRNRRFSILELYKNRGYNYDNMDVGDDLMSELTG